MKFVRSDEIYRIIRGRLRDSKDLRKPQYPRKPEEAK
jgi:hypothetical protein